MMHFYRACVLALLAATSLPAQCFLPVIEGELGHGEITRDGIEPIAETVQSSERRFAEWAIREIVIANTEEDKIQTPERHFDGDTFRVSSGRLVVLKDEIIKQLVAGDGSGARELLGQALHPLQDYYSHTSHIDAGGPFSTIINPSLGVEKFGHTPDPNGFCANRFGLLTGKPSTSALTSGFYALDGIGPDPGQTYLACDAPAGKCSHGSSISTQAPLFDCGLNKDSDARPNHTLAFQLATTSTTAYVRQVLALIRFRLSEEEANIAVCRLMGIPTPETVCATSSGVVFFAWTAPGFPGSSYVTLLGADSGADLGTVQTVRCPGYIVTNPLNGWAYVLGSPVADTCDRREISVIDPITRSVIASISLSFTSKAMTLSADGSKLFVVHESAGRISVVNLASNSVDSSLLVGGSPRGIGATPDGQFLYVANSAFSRVNKVNISSGLVVGNISGLVNPEELVVSNDGSRAFVLHAGNGYRLSTLDLSSQTIVQSVLLGSVSLPRGLAVNAARSRAYVGNGSGHSVTVVDLTLGSVINTIPDLPFAYGVSLNVSGSRLFVSNARWSPGISCENRVSIVDTGTNSVSNVVYVGGSCRDSMTGNLTIAQTLGKFVGSVVGR